jgi:hypothetical protein
VPTHVSAQPPHARRAEPQGPGQGDQSSPSPPESAASAEADEAPVAQADTATARASAAAVVEEQPVDFERVVSLWPAVVDQVRDSGSELLSTYIAPARPVALETDGPAPSIKLGFPPSAAFNKRKAESQEARECLADAVRTIVGERLRTVYVELDADEAVDVIGGDAELSEEELIAKLKSEFDAEEFEDAEDVDAEEEATR